METRGSDYSRTPIKRVIPLLGSGLCLGLRVLGFRVLGFRVLGFRVLQGLGF